MRLRRAGSEDVQVHMTPLIDVVFLLLIFFMVSTTFERKSELDLRLPEANAERVERNPEGVEVSIDAAGRVYVNGQPLVDARVAGIRAALADFAGGAPAAPLVIRADADTPYQAVVSVMDAAGQAGFVHLSLPVRRPGG